MSKRTRPRNLQALERRRRRHVRRSAIGVERAFMVRLLDEVFGPKLGPAEMADRIRRRLLTMGGRAPLFYEGGWGLPVVDMLTRYPGPWQEVNVDGARVLYRVKDARTMEFRVYPVAYAKKIEATIGFVNPTDVP